MDRREFLKMGTIAAVGGIVLANSGTAAAAPGISFAEKELVPPPGRKIRVAFALANRATIIDFCGPWEVFQDVTVQHENGNWRAPFQLYTVASSDQPITTSGGMRILPNNTIDNAPVPDLIVIPAMRTDWKLISWIKSMAPNTQTVLSVCTGSFQLARTGLLDGLQATTHHDFFNSFENNFPEITLERDVRYVEYDRVSTAGGLTSGIDLALRVVTRYFGEESAAKTAEYMEYHSDGWRNPA